MSRRVDMSGPLSEDDREYLHSRGLHETVARVDAEHSTADEEPEGDDDPGYETWTHADLQAEIDDRNQYLTDDKKMARSGKVADLAARLRAYDAAAL